AHGRVRTKEVVAAVGAAEEAAAVDGTKEVTGVVAAVATTTKAVTGADTEGVADRSGRAADSTALAVAPTQVDMRTALPS
ncbi:unnamed protein product, partial [Nesidiocoris tenuis]